jgi:hypothetical protein
MRWLYWRAGAIDWLKEEYLLYEGISDVSASIGCVSSTAAKNFGLTAALLAELAGLSCDSRPAFAFQDCPCDIVDK